MLKIFKIIVIVLVVLIAALLAFAATKPDTFSVERTATINAPPEKIFPLIADFHQWQTWSPWEKIDPTMVRTFSGAPSGQGAVYAWEGQGKAGAGRMEITSASPSSKVEIKLDFIKPFESSNVVDFTLEPEGDATKVTWSMTGPSAFITKIMCVFVSMDKMIGPDFERGLANLKAAAEK